jgi:TonB family protein
MPASTALMTLAILLAPATDTTAKAGEIPANATAADAAEPAEAVRYTAYTAITKVEPTPPEATRTLPPQTCESRVHTDTSGIPTEVTVSGCAAAFHESVVAAMKQWRFAPIRVDGVAAPGHFVIPVTFNAE